MTHNEFNKLYANGEIVIKTYGNEASGLDKEEKTIEAFEYNGRFYLRIHKVYRYLTGERRCGKRYKMTKESHFIKEFETKQQANNYFKKVAEGCRFIK